ncbi:AsnC family transcriptional regulator [Niabella ginsenosidivorans]|uniref:AsnC family transcriptional regulator n=1 Tax=Niabella ginsenosidivorans TaxID=1176587 RepID=A0A1A9HYW3_9BACT|nr:Lrp/AsnC family transcriptional regulator [Niabella ginsenosidivorans]ANH80597.1 AsnC family transcriptional regulator [Niabella ginsenosidivorans]
MEKRMIHLDETDLAILELLQEDARITNVALANQLKMAPSAMLERVRKLEEKGVVKGYSAAIDPLAVNRELLVFIFIKTKDSFANDKSARALAAIPQVMEVHHIAGDDCYLVKARLSGPMELMEMKRSKFSKIPNIISMRTTIVLETVKESSHISIEK